VMVAIIGMVALYGWAMGWPPLLHEDPQTGRFASGPQGPERARSWPLGLRKLGDGPAFSQEET
jgi:hypothetical protein